MREILFRGAIVDSENKWTYGDLISTVPYRIVNLINGTDCYVYENTIGQYTGLTDKNGVKIFDGDIVSIGDGNLGKVIFVNGCFKMADIKYSNRNLCLLSSWNVFSEVIGNIHDNPELLEVSQNEN